MESNSCNVELQWVCNSFKDLVFRCWEGEYFLFNSHTGHTHVLNQLSWDILSKCAEQPCSESSLLELVLAVAPGEGQESLLESLDIHLDHLAQLGFIETVDIHAFH